MKKDISCTWNPKESKNSNTHIRQKQTFKIKIVARDKEGHHMEDQGINSRRYNNCKYICTQCRSTSVYKANANSHKKKKSLVTQ